MESGGLQLTQRTSDAEKMNKKLAKEVLKEQMWHGASGSLKRGQLVTGLQLPRQRMALESEMEKRHAGTPLSMLMADARAEMVRWA